MQNLQGMGAVCADDDCATVRASLVPKGSLIEHLGIYSLNVLIPYEESLTQVHIRDDKSIELTTGLANLLSSLR